MFEKLSKYKDLEIEVEKMWHLKTTTIPLVAGTLGLIKKGTNAFIEKITIMDIANIKLIKAKVQVSRSYKKQTLAV